MSLGTSLWFRAASCRRARIVKIADQEVGEVGFQVSRELVTEHRARADQLSPIPGQGAQLLRRFRVGHQRAIEGAIRPQQGRQYPSIAQVRLRAGDPEALPMAIDGLGIDRVNGEVLLQQGPDERCRGRFRATRTSCGF